MDTVVRSSEAGWVAKSWALVGKDVRIELRARDTLLPMIVFALSVTLLLAFTLPTAGGFEAPREIPGVGTVPVAAVLAGFFWVTVLFAGLIGFARTFEFERSEDALESLLLAPVDRTALFASKAVTNLLSLVLLEVLLVPIFAVLFGIDLVGSLGPLIAVLVLVDIGFVSIGTVFAALAAQTTSRELILPVLALPALVPVFIAGVELTADLLLGSGLAEVTERGWFGILIGFDVIFITASALAFEFTID